MLWLPAGLRCQLSTSTDPFFWPWPLIFKTKLCFVLIEQSIQFHDFIPAFIYIYISRDLTTFSFDTSDILTNALWQDDPPETDDNTFISAVSQFNTRKDKNSSLVRLKKDMVEEV